MDQQREADSQSGDFEKMTVHELQEFCPTGKVDDVDCETSDGIPSYSTGEIIQCTVPTGLVCHNTDNFPIPCSDYKIRYHCDGNGGPVSVRLTTDGVGTWSRWINRLKPADNGGDFEYMTSAELSQSFCPMGRVDRVQCETADGLPTYRTGEILQCTPDKGLICKNSDNFPLTCSDYKIRYHCDNSAHIVG